MAAAKPAATLLNTNLERKNGHARWLLLCQPSTANSLGLHPMSLRVAAARCPKSVHEVAPAARRGGSGHAARHLARRPRHGRVAKQSKDPPRAPYRAPLG